jgi:hypothetical protein
MFLTAHRPRACVVACRGLLLWIIAFFAAGLCLAQADEPQGRSLFNGRDLTGWAGAAGYWRVEDRAITGETTAANPLSHHTYLIWRGGDVADFELRLQFRLIQGNSGVQYRSRELPEFSVGGYQCNIETGRPGGTAVLEEMQGRGGHLAEIGQQVRFAPVDPAEVESSIRRQDWNDLVIRAEGSRLRHWLNGRLAVEVVDEQQGKSARRGILALQLHDGRPMKIQFRQIQLKTLATVSPADEERCVEQAHREIWRRFINPHGLLYDYTALDGKVLLPTAEECRLAQPNALGWWTPIENGAFFGGLYLDALCNRWRALRTPAAADEARRAAGGLLALASAGSTPGFVARGFADDGRSHYAASSSDQTFPWFYGLWRYANSGVPDAAQRRQVVECLERVARGLENNGWKMPCDQKDFGHFGHWSGGFAGTRGTLTGAEPQFDASVRFLFVLRALHQLTGTPRWQDLYRTRLAERPRASQKTRLEICSGGVQYVAPGEPPRYPESPPIWTSASSQAGLRALLEMESDATLRAQFQRGLDANAASALRFIAGFRNYDNDNRLAFDIDWRKLNVAWRPQPEIGAAVKVATQEYRLWSRQSPRRLAEADQMRDPLFAAWIVVLSGNRTLIAKAREEIRGALAHYRWERLHTCLFFMSECVYWQLRRETPPSPGKARG